MNHAKPGTLQTQELETKSNGLGKDTEVIAPPQERAQTLSQSLGWSFVQSCQSWPRTPRLGTCSCLDLCG